MIVEALSLEGVKLITPVVHRDRRGFFVESFHAPRYRSEGIDVTFVQDNHSRSIKGMLRGLHYQAHPGQAKLVWVSVGEVYDVVVDIRPRSATFGKWLSVTLNATTYQQLYVPVGFAHGFCVVSEVAEVQYKVSAVYDPARERTIKWDDPDLGVVWPCAAPVVSERDAVAPSFAECQRDLEV